MKKKYLIALLISLLAFGTLYDMQISLWFERINSNLLLEKYYRFFEIFGGASLGLIFTLCFALFANFGFRNQNNWQAISNSILTSIVLSATFYSFASFLNPSGGNSGGAVSLPIFIGCVALAIITAFWVIRAFDLVETENYLFYRRAALLSILYLICLTLIISGLKQIWARPRFWVIENGDADFVKWFIFNGNGVDTVTNGFKSFPSGHTANAFASIILSLWSVRYASLIFNLGLSWGTLTALSRIVGCQHFLTDTVVSAIIAISLFYLFSSLHKSEKLRF